MVLRLHGPLDVTALERSLEEIIRRHESFRTTFPSRDGRPVTTLRGGASDRFRRLVARLGEQQAMARTTGNYRRGNERTGSTPDRTG